MVEPNTLILIYIGESTSLSCGSRSAIDKDEPLRGVTISLKLGLGLGIGISVNGSGPSVNHPARSKFEVSEDIRLNILEVATCRTFTRS